MVDRMDIHSDQEDLSKDPAWDSTLRIPLPDFNPAPVLGDGHIHSKS